MIEIAPIPPSPPLNKTRKIQRQPDKSSSGSQQKKTETSTTQPTEGNSERHIDEII